MTGRIRTIKLSGPFSDHDIAELLTLARRIDDANPTGLFLIDIFDPDGSTNAGEELLRKALPPMPDRATAFARSSYHNDDYPERLCDRCGKTYRGPAVYCSLECALADA